MSTKLFVGISHSTSPRMISRTPSRAWDRSGSQSDDGPRHRPARGFGFVTMSSPKKPKRQSAPLTEKNWAAAH